MFPVAPSSCRQPNSPLVAPGQIEHHAADLTVTFAADVRLADLQSVLSRANQWLPADGDETRAVGELILRNTTGPLRLGYGAWRDVLLGAQFTNGRGELITVGGRVLKNVAGYDVTKLLIGSGGVFGTPVSFTARTWKRPVAGLHVTRSTVPDVTALLATPLKPQWVSLAGDVVLGYLGDDRLIDHIAAEVGKLEPSAVRRVDLAEDTRSRLFRWPASTSRGRVAVPPGRVREFFGMTNGTSCFADPVFGVVLVSDPVDRPAVLAAARAVGGHAWFYTDAGRLSEISIDPVAFALLRRLKAAFDPDNHLPPLPTNIGLTPADAPHAGPAL